jgi:anti-anti-sigma factor
MAHLEGGVVAAIMLDLSELTFLDCSALHGLLAARGRAKTNWHQLILVGVSSGARRLFQLTGTGLLIDKQEAVSVLDQFNRSQTHRAGQSLAAHVTADV